MDPAGHTTTHPWHAMELAAVESALDVDDHGLSPDEAATRLNDFGPNELTQAPGESRLKMLISEFTNPLILILLGAASLLLVVSVVSPESSERGDGLLILGIVLANATLSFIQNHRAQKGIEALERAAAIYATVVRAGRRSTVHARELVPGDIVAIEEGDRIPADGRLLAVSHLQVDESPLTGESLPIAKIIAPLPGSTDLAERTNCVYSGTTALVGRASFVVTQTGMRSQIGQIAQAIEAIQEGPSSFQREIADLGKRITLIIAALVAVVAVVQLVLVGQTLLETFVVAVALAVAAIPEGLPVVMTLALAFGTRRMLERKALVASLPVVEIIGSANVICTDKTGTITEGRMSLRQLFLNGDFFEITGDALGTDGDLVAHGQAADLSTHPALLAAGLCNNAHLNADGTFLGDPTETALLAGAYKAGVPLIDYTRTEELPFSSERRMMSVVVEAAAHKMLLAKGAPERILDISSRVLTASGEQALDAPQRQIIETATNDLASQGFRVLALATGQAPTGGADIVEANLTFVGLAGIADPPRAGARAAIQACVDAGIRVVMITGDAQPTAVAVAADVGLTGDAILGRQLDDLTSAELAKTVSHTNVFARAEPRHKVQILEALQVGGQVVVMTGDGVNDAPALKAADVGISMGVRGTEVARDASDMVLLDDSFPTIVSAVEEGRRIFANIKKFINYLLIGNFAEVVVILIAGVFGYLPVTAVQILWINLITDSGPAVALGIDPARPGLMREPPQQGRLIGQSMLALIAGTGLVMATIILGTFAIGLALFDLETAQTMTFTAFVVQEYLRLAIIRYQERTSLFVNRWLTASVGGSLLLQIGILYGPFQEWFGVTALGFTAWGIILGGLLLAFGLALVVNNAVTARFGRP
jgi:P-type Ca2+ transporter type 2C